MKRRGILFLTLLVVLSMVLTMYSPVFAEDKRTQKEKDKATEEALKEALEKALKKTSEKIMADLNNPDFIEMLMSKAVAMPAVKERPVIWQYLSTTMSVKAMKFIAPDRLLITYFAGKLILVDTTSGALLWKFVPEGWSLAYYDIIAAFSDLILIREEVNIDNEVVLAAIDAKSGKQVWFKALKAKKRSFQFVPAPAAGVVLVTELEKKKVTLSALDLFSGAEKWRQTFKIGKRGHASSPKLTSGEIWHFYGKTARIDAATGKPAWGSSGVSSPSRMTSRWVFQNRR